MPRLHLTPSPAALANARAVVDVTHASTCNPALIGGAWETMKAARGQSCNFAMLARPAHLILSTPAPAAPPAPTAFEARIDARIKHHIAIKGYRPRGGGDAA